MLNTHNIENDFFQSLANHWWDENGPFQALHSMNLVRVPFITQHLGNLSGLKILDVGCGGGLLSEPLARLGAKVTGIDQTPEAITTAINHSSASGLKITYKNQDLKSLRGKFAAITCMEVLEHVDNVPSMLFDISDHLQAGGMAFFSTINRTWQSLIFVKYAAEYLLKLAPIGAHAHKMFIKPHELVAMARNVNLEVITIQGLSFHPLSKEWNLSKHTSMNYLISFRKAS